MLRILGITARAFADVAVDPDEEDPFGEAPADNGRDEDADAERSNGEGDD